MLLRTLARERDSSSDPSLADDRPLTDKGTEVNRHRVLRAKPEAIGDFLKRRRERPRLDELEDLTLAGSEFLRRRLSHGVSLRPREYTRG